MSSNHPADGQNDNYNGEDVADDDDQDVGKRGGILVKNSLMG